MTIPVEVAFHGIEKSDAIEQRVRHKIARLEKRFGRMTGCRVAIEASQRSPQKPKVFLVKIEVSVPQRERIVVSLKRQGSHAGEELVLAVRDAFAAAERKVDGVAAKINERSRIERSRRRPRKPVDGDGEA